MPFFTPFIAELSGHPVICYTDTDVAQTFPSGMTEGDARDEMRAFDNLLPRLPQDTNFSIAFLWTTGKAKFVDLWVQRQYPNYGPAAPMTTLLTLRHPDASPTDIWEDGNGCTWTRIVSGREAEHFLEVVELYHELSPTAQIDRYVGGERPRMPEGFIVPWPEGPNPDLAGKGTWI